MSSVDKIKWATAFKRGIREWFDMYNRSRMLYEESDK